MQIKDNKTGPRTYIPAMTTAAAVVMIIAGIIIGEPADVWQKAVSICLSCIGIG